MTKLARFFLYCVPFIILIVLANTYFPFIGGKYYAFRLLVTLALAAALLALAFGRGASFKQFFARSFGTPLGKALVVFVIVFLLACIFAFDPHAAFWSNFERGEGGFQMIHYFVFFVLLAGLFTQRGQWRWLFGVSLIAAVGMTLYGLAGALSPGHVVGAYDAVAKLDLWHRLTSPDARFQGSLGNAAYVAPYLLFATFYALWLWSEGRLRGKLSMWRTVGYGALIVWFAIFFTLSQTRGAFVGLAAAILVALLYVGFSRRELRKRAIAVVVALVIIGGGVFAFRNTPVIQKLPGARLLSISTTDRTFQTRLWDWEAAIKGFKERPVLGWGPENYPTVFDKFFDIRHFIPGQNTETWFDRAHSVVFDYLAETGLLGLLAYLAVLVVFFVEFGKWIRRRRGAMTMTTNGATPPNGTPRRDRKASNDAPAVSVFQESLLVALPVAYFVQGLALFDVLPIFMNLMIFFAFALYLMHQEHAPRPNGAPSNVSPNRP